MPDRVDLRSVVTEQPTIIDGDRLYPLATPSDALPATRQVEDVARTIGLDNKPAHNPLDMAGITAPPEFFDLLGSLAAEGRTDEVSDVEARNFAQRHRMAAQKRVYTPNGSALLAGPGLGIDQEPKPPSTLPMIVGEQRLIKPESLFPPEIKWSTIYDTPGYYQQFIRSLGRDVFRSFPCFEEHERRSTRAGDDPLGSIQLLANLKDGKPTPQGVLDYAAAYIVQNGQVLDGAHIHIPMNANMPMIQRDYKPRYILVTTDTQSILLVEERVVDGAHRDAKYIYAWNGGSRFYAKNAAAMQRIGGMLKLPRPESAGRSEGAGATRSLENLRRRADPLPLAHEPRSDNAAKPISSRVLREIEVEKRPRSDLMKSLPVAASLAMPGAPLVAKLRSLGFLSYGSAEGPGMRKSLEDGREICILGDNGTPLVRSQAYRFRELVDGEIRHEVSFSDGSELELLMSSENGVRLAP